MTAPAAYLTYTLKDGWVTHWLVAGLHAVALRKDLSGAAPPPADSQALSDLHPLGTTSGIEAPPVQFRPLRVDEAILEKGERGIWELYTCYDDPFIHLSADTSTPSEAPTPSHLISWAYVELVSPMNQDIQATLVTNGPIDVWCDDAHTYSGRPLSQPLSSEATLPLTLRAGTNPVLIRFEQLGTGPTPTLLALRLSGAEGVTLRLPSDTQAPDKLQALETLFEFATLDRDSFAANDTIAIHWPADLHEQATARAIAPNAPIMLRLQKPDGRIYAETRGTPRPGEPTETVPGQHVLPGSYQLVLMPPPEAYAIERLGVRRVFDIEVRGITQVAGSDEAGAYVKRLYDAVQMALRLRAGLISELAAMTLGAWRYVDGDAVCRAAARSHIRALSHSMTDRDRDLLALAGMRARFSDDPAFPAGLADEIDATFAALPPVSPDVIDEVGLCLRGALEILVGQLYPEYEALRTEAEERMQAWLFTKGRYGLRTLADDGDALDTLIFGLSHLADLAQDALTRELAAVLLDKILFTVALNSFRGSGAGGLPGTTATLSRVLWGAGVVHTHLWSIVGLANARAYPIPPLVADIVRDLAREDLAPFSQAERHLDPNGAWAYDRVLYRTPETVLTSTQGSGPGGPFGAWHAALGPEATVTVTYPAHAGRARLEDHGYWRGNRAAPHMAQRRDALLIQYPESSRADTPAGDAASFTHAHFPRYAFDEHVLRDGWVFARVGTAYIALTASQPLTLMTTGHGAYRELRAGGGFTTWLCQMGRAAEDGDFAAFQAAILATPVHFEERSVRWTTIRGETLTLAWEGELDIEGASSRRTREASAAAPHYATPYCTVGFPADEMEIRLGNSVLKLDFSD